MINRDREAGISKPPSSSSVKSLEPLVEAGDPEVPAVLKPTLNDPARNVRVAAAWALRATLDLQCRAGCELKTMIELYADQPASQERQAHFELARRSPRPAREHSEFIA